MRYKSKLLIFTIIISMLLGLFPQMSSYATDINLSELTYVGPGRYETDLLIIQGGEVLEDYTAVGTAAVWNTKNELFVHLEVEEGWMINEVSIFAGNDEIPVSFGGNPKPNEFPYIEKLEDPSTGYVKSIKLVEELDMSWGVRDQDKRLPKVAICAKIENTNNKSGSQYFAWAEGNQQFDVNSGWWMRYAVVHPKTGHFIDSPVAGISYVTPTQNGKTDDGGAFEYIEGEDVRLNIGSVNIGTARASHKVTPMSLLGNSEMESTAVVNMAMLLQSLDEDSEPNAGINISDNTTLALEDAYEEMELDAIDFYNTEEVYSLLDLTNEKLGGRLNLVSREEALDNLEKGTGSNIVRKNVSKSGDYENTKAKLEVMQIYVPSQKANNTPVDLEYYQTFEGEEEDVLIETRNVAKPLISCYTEAIEGTNADDIIAAVSRDEGETWKTTNLSKSADKSSFKLADGTEYPGDTHKPQIKVSGNYILAVWTSKYGKTGKPTYSIKINDEGSEDYYPYDDPYYEEDIWGVSGPQRSFDYTELDYPEVGELPFSVVWACRGVIDEDLGTITWYKPERLTSGRRDANQIMMNGVEDAGFAIVWQEDPEGLRPGEQAGPGEGWSGATTNHKTDIWYSYVLWEDFETIDANYISKGASQNKEEDEEDEELIGRPKALVPFKLPVRLSDNDTLNLDNMKVETPGLVLPTTEYTWVDVDSSTFTPIITEDKIQGTHQYGYVDLKSYYPYYIGPDLCDQIYYEKNNQNADKYIAITSDGRLMDGNTGASRPNIMIQKYVKADSTISAWVNVCYEETKGVGSGPPPEDEVLPDDASDTQGVGSQRGKYSYVADEGKNVIYHSFDLSKPDLVSAGHVVNPQVKIDTPEAEAFYSREDDTLPGVIDGLLYLTDEEGNIKYDWDGVTPLAAYENARRPRMIIQGKSAAIAGKEPSEKGTVMVMVYKMGEEGKGRPSDIFMQRWEVSSLDKGNPYDFKYMNKTDVFNISSVAVGDTMINENNSEESKGEGVKVLNWYQTVENLADETWTNPYDDARAHRGILRGDMIAIALDWTPNWAASRNGNDVYNLYVRRSFDGGKSFTTNPSGTGVTHLDIFKTGLGDGTSSDERLDDMKEEVYSFYDAGAFEPMRNLSHMSNSKASVIEPRLVGGQGTIAGSPYPEDKRDANVFWVTYGTSTNPGKDSTELKEPLDLYYSHTEDFGDTYYEVTKIVNPDSSGNNQGTEKVVWDWLAKDTGQKKAAQAECQIRMTADGSIFYSVWNETSDTSSDVMFRRIIPSGIDIRSILEYVDETAPIISIAGIADGDIVSETVNINVSLNELGAWTADLTTSGQKSSHSKSFEIIPTNSKKDYELEVFAEDLSGNKSTKKIAFTVDGRVPQITVTGIENNTHTQSSVKLDIVSTGESEKIDLKKNGVSIDYSSNQVVDEEGAYELIVSSTVNGLSAEMNVKFVIDRTAPKIVINNVKDGATYINSVKPEIIVTDNIGNTLDELEIKLNGLDYLSSTKITLQGDHTLYVQAVDQAGNSAESAIKFRIVSSDDPSDNGSGGSTSSNSTINVDGDEAIPLGGSKGSNIIPKGEKAEIVYDEGALKLIVPVGTFDEDVYFNITKLTEKKATDQMQFMIGENVFDIVIQNSEGKAITKFANDVTLEFAVDLDDMPEGYVNHEIKVAYWDENIFGGSWIAVPSELDIEKRVVRVHINHFSVYSIVSFQGFPKLEDCECHWCEKDIYKMVSVGVCIGDDTGLFRPNDQITRQELAKVLVDALELEMGKEVLFNDSLNVSSWATNYVNIALSGGVMAVDEKGDFRPRDFATREDLIYAAQQSFELNEGVYEEIQFNDEKEIDAKLLETVNLMVKNGLISGYPDKTIRLQNFMTRAEMIRILSMYLSLEPKVE